MAALPKLTYKTWVSETLHPYGVETRLGFGMGQKVKLKLSRPWLFFGK